MDTSSSAYVRAPDNDEPQMERDGLLSDKQHSTSADEVSAGNLKGQPSMAEPFADMSASSRWSTSLFDCGVQPGGGSLQCVSCCMPYVQFGTLVEQLPDSGVPMAGRFCHGAAGWLALDVLSALCHCMVWPGVSLIPMSACLGYKLRRHLRNKYNIEGTGYDDFCVAWWCAPCALAQQSREVIIRNAAEQTAMKQQARSLVPPAGPNYLFGHMLMHSPNAPAPGGASAGSTTMQIVILPGPPPVMPAMGMPVAASPAQQQAPSAMSSQPSLPTSYATVGGLPRQRSLANHKEGYEPHGASS